MFKKPFFNYHDYFLDVDECKENLDDRCNGNAVCINTEGSYACECMPGFVGDGEYCECKFTIIEILRMKLLFKSSCWCYFCMKNRSSDIGDPTCFLEH